MERVCRPDGQILLLEHGKSDYDWLNRILDNGAMRHAENFGCWWNRDIQKIVQDAGLEIVTLKRYHFGTTYYIIAKPNAETKAQQKLALEQKAREEKEQAKNKPRRHAHRR